MKAYRILFITLIVVLAIATTAWVLRNSIIQRLSGPLLSEYGLSISDVSLDALARENASISYIELQHQSGTTFRIEELSLPIGRSPDRLRKFSARRLTMVMAETGDPEALSVAGLADQLLFLPEAMPDTVVTVNELVVAKFPSLHDLIWSTVENRHTLAASLGVVDLSLRIETRGENGFEAIATLDQTSLAGSEQTITIGIGLTDTGLRINGVAALDLPSIGTLATSIAESFGATLAGAEFANGVASMSYEAEFPYDTKLPATSMVRLNVTRPFEFAFSVKSGVIGIVSVRSASPVTLEADYPEERWFVSADELSLQVTYDDWKDVSVDISGLSCTEKLSCFMNVEADVHNADLTVATAVRLELAASQDMDIRDDGVRLSIRPGARLSLAGLDVGGTGIGRAKATLASPATLRLSDSGWQMSADAVEAVVESLSVTGSMNFSAPFALSALVVAETQEVLSMSTGIESAAGRVRRDGRDIALPGVRGNVTLQRDNIVAELTTAGLQNEAAIRAKHDLSAGSGNLRLGNGTLSFGARKLSDRVSPLSNAWDISAGTVSFDLQFNWENSDSGWQLDGQSSVTASNLEGHYKDTVFAGLTTALLIDFGRNAEISVAPASMRLALLEVGLPIRNISADYSLHPDALSVDVKNLTMEAFGGSLTADPFTYALQSERNILLLRAESIELTELLTVKEFEALELSGRIGGEFPIIIEGTEVSILDGALTGEAPGGVIRYQAGAVPGNAGTSAVGIVTEALRNFEYDMLTSSVAYSKDGDLVLQMRISGRNPDMKDGRPVILNLGIENNVPQMLKSLQATRAVEEILEKRARK